MPAMAPTTALLGPALDQSPPFLGRIQARERHCRFCHIKEAAQGLPALGNVEHKQPFRRDSGTHFLAAALVGRWSVKEPPNVCALIISLAICIIARMCGGGGIC